MLSRSIFEAALRLTGLFAIISPQPAWAVDVTVSLNYSTYIGTAQSGGTGVTQWLGIRYAAPPVEDLRFARPQDPPVVTTPQAATAVSDLFGNVFVNRVVQVNTASLQDLVSSTANTVSQRMAPPTIQLPRKTASFC